MRCLGKRGGLKDVRHKLRNAAVTAPGPQSLVQESLRIGRRMFHAPPVPAVQKIFQNKQPTGLGRLQEVERCWALERLESADEASFRRMVENFRGLLEGLGQPAVLG